MNEPTLIAPNSPEAEEGVLGSVIINPECFLEVSFLNADDFFIVRNGWIWNAIQALHRRYDAIDNLTIIEELDTTGKLDAIGGSAYITRLINNTPTHIHAETYARLVERASIRRKLLQAAGDIANIALQENAEISEVVSRAEQMLEAVATRRSAAFLSSGDEIVESATDQFLEWLGEPSEVRGLRSGIPNLDSFVGGFVPGNRPYTLYGATGMGKSTLAAFIAINFAEQSPGLIISTEMDSVFWIHRAVSDLTGIPFNKLKSGQLSREEVNLASGIYERFKRLAPCFHSLRISDPTPAEIKANVRRLARQFGCTWVLVDSVNNISVPGATDIYPKTSAAADCTLSVAIDQGMVVLQTAQTGRNAKQRTNKMPQLNDAEGSGKIEQNSHMVLGIYRHGYYVERREAKPNPDIFPDGNTTLIVLKNATGLSGKWIPLEFKAGGFTPDDRVNRKSPAPAPHWTDDNNDSEDE